ncbi:MAG: formate dehydrogenase, partial [Sulfurovaceae bacterium]
KRLNDLHFEDVIYAPLEAKKEFGSDHIILKTEHGQSAKLRVEYSNKIKPNTLYTTFHHASSKINALFGDECDELIMTARFKSLKVEVEPIG